jgi:hypothetical protein
MEARYQNKSVAIGRPVICSPQQVGFGLWTKPSGHLVGRSDHPLSEPPGVGAIMRPSPSGSDLIVPWRLPCDLATRNRATLAGMVAPATIVETKMAEDVSSTIAALEDERYSAMLSGDAATLDRLLDDRLRQVHSSGHVDNEASWMTNFGRLWQYR